MGAEPAHAGLDDEVGRNETRIYSAPFYPVAGRTLVEQRIPERLERLGYERVRGRRPTAAGEFFWGHEVFWIYRRASVVYGREHDARLVGLRLRKGDGLVLGFREPAPGPDAGDREVPSIWIEPELIAESFEANRARTIRVELAELPEHAWQVVLALEDHRFLEHGGIDPRSVVRAAVKNTQSGGVVQGGSTITQQLIKIRDLTPRRNFRRKASEAVRALALEARHGKEEILQAYLNAVYYGHVDGIALYGLGTAARAYFGKAARDLSLAESAVLGAMVQAPNRINPQRPGDDLRERFDYALRRMGELGWADSSAVERTRRAGLPPTRIRTPARPEASHLRRWVADIAAREAPRRAEKGKGFVAWTQVDPILQADAEAALAVGLASIRRRAPGLGESLSGALLSIDADTGAVLAYVGGDPAAKGDRFDRVRSARRQPGSTVKPLVLLEAFERCGGREPVYPARRVSDRPLRIEIEGANDWKPENSKGDFRGEVSVQEATIDSLNVPFVRLARWCGFDATAARLQRAGIALGSSPPPSFVLGALEVSPLELATAYSAIAGDGRRRAVRPLAVLSRPSGRKLERWGVDGRRVVSSSTAYLVRDLLKRTVEEGTATAAQLDEPGTFGKTGTSSDRRDAWFVGGHDGVVTVVWIGRDEGGRLGFTGSTAAAPVWRDFMAKAIGSRAPRSDRKPDDIVARWFEPTTGLLTSSSRRGSEPYLFRRGHEPAKRRIWRSDTAVPVID